ncbi:hypothetical protein F5883DRAFT_662270 [Diaporthe sp. PMI_573]|nr:hypothetical protein F5883DRAFT_662270 [Diaporthaceae sp. PMI_573]
MMEKGVQNLLILHHNAEKNSVMVAVQDTAEKEGRNVQILNCDLSSEESLVELLNHASGSMPPIRGVVIADALNRFVSSHCHLFCCFLGFGHMSDNLRLWDEALRSVTFDQWKHAALSRVVSTLTLDRYLPPSLSFFVVLSSLAGVVGEPPEADFSVGSTFQAALTRNRAASGRPFTCIDIGGVGAGGGGDGVHARRRAATTTGSTPISAAEVLQLVEEAIQRQPATPEDTQVIVGLPAWSKAMPEDLMSRDRRFGTMRLAIRWAASTSRAVETCTIDPSSLLVQALGLNQEDSASEAVALALRACLAAILRMEAEDIDISQSLATYGIDELIAVEMRSWLATASCVKLSVLEILNALSIREMARVQIHTTKSTYGSIMWIHIHSIPFHAGFCISISTPRSPFHMFHMWKLWKGMDIFGGV